MRNLITTPLAEVLQIAGGVDGVRGTVVSRASTTETFREPQPQCSLSEVLEDSNQPSGSVQLNELSRSKRTEYSTHLSRYAALARLSPLVPTRSGTSYEITSFS